MFIWKSQISEKQIWKVDILTKIFCWIILNMQSFGHLQLLSRRCRGAWRRLDGRQATGLHRAWGFRGFWCSFVGRPRTVFVANFLLLPWSKFLFICCANSKPPTPHPKVSLFCQKPMHSTLSGWGAAWKTSFSSFGGACWRQDRHVVSDRIQMCWRNLPNQREFPLTIKNKMIQI
jgi:hypothetical protein